MGMSLRPAVRSELAVRLLETFAREADHAVLDDHETLSLRDVEGAQEVRRCRPLISTASWMSKRSPSTDRAWIASDAVLTFPSIQRTVAPE